MTEDADWLPTLIGYFEDYEDASADAREQAEKCRDYYDNKQWTDEEAEALRQRKQPVISDNHVRRKVDYLLGLEKQGRVDPKAYPRNPQDEQAAEAFTSGIRFVCDESDFDLRASNVWEHMLVEGAGGVDVYVEPREGDVPKICIVDIPWDRIFADPHSRRHDFSDAKYLGVVIWSDAEDAKAQWPDRVEAIETTVERSISDTFDDRPGFARWGDAKRNRVRIVQMNWNGPDGWMTATFTRGGFLSDPQPSPYLDDEGKPEPSLLFQSTYVDRDNNRYGAVLDMLDQQDEINKRRSKALHLLSVRQVVADKGAVDDVDVARRELARPDGYIEKNPGLEFEVQQTGDLAAGQAALLQQAQDALANMGPNASMQGKDPKDQSGRAIALQQQGGVIEAGALADRHRQWKRRVYRAVANRIRQFWTEETWVRVTDDERNARFVGLNRKVTLADALLEMPSEQEAMAVVQQMGLTAGDPRLQQVVRVENHVTDVPIDIVLDEAPDVVTLQSETFAMLTQMVQAGLAIPPAAVIEAAPLRSEIKEKVLKHLQGIGPDGQPLPPPPEVQQNQAQFELEKQKLALEQQKHQDEMALKQAEIAKPEAQPAPEGVDPIAAARLELDREKAAADVALRQAELELKAQLEGAKMRQSMLAATAEREAMDRDVQKREAETQNLAGAQQAAERIAAGVQDLLRAAQAIEAAAAKIAAPKRIIRGPDGRATGVETVN